MRLKFNPFTGSFDYVNDVFVPTEITANSTFTVDDNSQALMIRRILVDAGGRIVIGANSVLIQVGG